MIEWVCAPSLADTYFPVRFICHILARCHIRASSWFVFQPTTCYTYIRWHSGATRRIYMRGCSSSLKWVAPRFVCECGGPLLAATRHWHAMCFFSSYPVCVVDLPRSWDTRTIWVKATHHFVLMPSWIYYAIPKLHIVFYIDYNDYRCVYQTKINEYYKQYNEIPNQDSLISLH